MSGTDPVRAVAIDLALACPAWRKALPQAAGLARSAARAALALGGAAVAGESAVELSLVLADDALVQALNRRWRGRDAPTNVLSFASGDAPLAGRPLLLGDVVLAYETVAREAAAQGKPLADHLRHLIVHGVLHLLGFDHEAAAEAEHMEATERDVLAGLGIADPYRLREDAHG